jgi:hypothetical protein
MKTLLVAMTFLLSLSLFAGVPVLTDSEGKKIVNYLDEICADTFCGGDINYFPRSFKCDESSCTLKMDAVEYYSNYFDMTKINNQVGQTITDKNYILTTQSTFLIESWDIEAEEERMFNAISFSCQINGLQKSNQDWDKKREGFYEYIVSGCVPIIESLLKKCIVQ